MTEIALSGSKVLEVTLTGETVRAAKGSMIAYDGEVKFRGAGLGGGDGLKAALKRRATGESMALMECGGHGTVWFAKEAQEILLVELNGDQLKAESDQILLVTNGLKTDVAFAGLRGASAGQGLFTSTVSGFGTVALLSSGGPPIALEVSPRFPLVVDPDAYIASRGQLTESVVTDVSWKNLIGESSGEAFSLRFDGTGVVYIQPQER